MSFWQEPWVVSILIGLPSSIIALLGLRRAFKADKVSEQLGAASGSAQSIAQAFEGLNKVIESLNAYILILQADKRVAAEDIKILTVQRDALQKELNRMYRKYGDSNQA